MVSAGGTLEGLLSSLSHTPSCYIRWFLPECHPALSTLSPPSKLNEDATFLTKAFLATTKTSSKYAFA